MNAANPDRDEHGGSRADSRRAGSGGDKTNAKDSPADLIAALSGRDGGRERVVASRTRRVVLSSLGVMQEQKEDRNRSRRVALAVTLMVLLLTAPLAWEAMDSFIAGEHLGDLGSQLSVWACIVCSTLLAAAVVAGWWKYRS